GTTRRPRVYLGAGPVSTISMGGDQGPTLPAASVEEALAVYRPGRSAAGVIDHVLAVVPHPEVHVAASSTLLVSWGRENRTVVVTTGVMLSLAVPRTVPPS
ncbi:MAG: hypothetical protein M3203_12380, partial [Actinomycetota bacterium]|nr:hypothetical protein [Actinomycetota bacterium]